MDRMERHGNNVCFSICFLQSTFMVVVVAQTQPLLLQMHNVTGSQHLLKMDVPGMVIDYALHEMMPTHWDTTFCWLQNQNFFQREHHHGKSLKDPPMSCALGMLC